MPNSADRPRCSREMTPGTADAVPRPGTPAAACSVVGTRASTESGAGPGPSAGALWRGKGTVLLVDDEEAVRRVNGLMLQILGFNVLTAGDGATAVRKVEEKADAIDVILLDVTMPGMDGVVAYDEILRVRPDAHIVMTSGHPISEVERFFGGRRGFPFIQKPYTLHSLAAILKLVLEADM